MNTIIKNFGTNVSVYCLNHDAPLPMVVISNTEIIKLPFYACQDYMNEEHPCKNRLNIDDYLNIIEKFMDIVNNGDMFDDFTNYEFSYYGKSSKQKIQVKCLVYNDKEKRLGVYNETVLGKRN